MKLLIITQKVNKNDPILGFFHRWIEEFAKHFERVTVICLEKGEYSLPSNVSILSLGKENRLGRFRYLFNFYKFIFKERKKYDIVFVHMNPIYLILGGILWRGWGKKISIWYTHKTVDLKLKIAEKFTDIIFTASEKSFRLETSKVRIMGQGINTEIFRPSPENILIREKVIVTTGRLSPIKNIHKMLEGISEINIPFKFLIIGEATTEIELSYAEEIRLLIKKSNLEDKVLLLGSKTQGEVASILGDSTIFINLSETGSLDKAILEALSCGIPALSANVAFEGILSKWNLYKPWKEAFVYRLIELLNDVNIPDPDDLRSYVREYHSLETLIVNIKRILLSEK